MKDEFYEPIDLTIIGPGRWKLTGRAYAFDIDGTLVDFVQLRGPYGTRRFTVAAFEKWFRRLRQPPR